MPANNSARLDFLQDDLQQKSSEVPLEFQTIPELFKDGAFVGVEAFFGKDSSTETVFQTQSPTDSIQADVSSILEKKTKNNSLLSQISAEELEDVLNKLRTVLTLPPGQLDRESELYLEQQISEMLGFEVTNILEGHQLQYNTGKIKALPHLKRHPTDAVKSHEKYQQASMSQKRGAFGWFLEQGKTTADTIQLEKYYIALQLFYSPEWSSSPREIKKWYKYRKIVVLNPFDKVAVVCAVGSIGPQIPVRYQFGASPEVIVEGKFWSSQSNGRAIVLFVDDQQNSIPLGPLTLGIPSKATTS